MVADMKVADIECEASLHSDSTRDKNKRDAAEQAAKQPEQIEYQMGHATARQTRQSSASLSRTESYTDSALEFCPEKRSDRKQPSCAEKLATSQRVIIKIGSSLLVDTDGAVRLEWMNSLCADIAQLGRRGVQPIIVSSGAIALGIGQLGLPRRHMMNLEDAQAAAAVGQIALASMWRTALARQGYRAAQILLTLDDLEDRRHYLNAAATLGRLLALGVIPVVNENDTVATEEIRFGDNDRLAARVGQAVQGDLVILLSDVDGLYSHDPTMQQGAEHIAYVAHIDERIAAMAAPSAPSGVGSGGMVAKLEAARIATRSGIALIIASGQKGYPLTRLANSRVGTLFATETKISAHKAWLSGRVQCAGQISIDSGAVAALEHGKSLLAAGVTAIEGTFTRGDMVAILASNGAIVAHGLSEYDSTNARHIMGLRSESQAAVLGYAPRSALIHRDQMIIL